MVLVNKQKSLINPSDRKTPVNLSIPLNLLDVIDEEAFKRYGLSQGARSKVVVEILKESLKIK